MLQRQSSFSTKTKNGITTPVAGSTASIRPALLVPDPSPFGASSAHQLHLPMKCALIRPCSHKVVNDRQRTRTPTSSSCSTSASSLKFRGGVSSG